MKGCACGRNLQIPTVAQLEPRAWDDNQAKTIAVQVSPLIESQLYHLSIVKILVITI